MNSEFGDRKSKANPGRPCLVGLTGGLASGKSTAAQLLDKLGVPVLDADTVVHDLYRPGAPGARAVTEIFGPGVLDGDGAVDRAILGGRVLRDAALRLALEGAIHPLVREEIARWLGTLDPGSPAVVEAALLVETGSYRAYDVLVVVWCERDQQIERALNRGVSEDRVQGLLDAQFPLDDKREVADIVVDNSGPQKDLSSEVDRVWQQVVKLCSERRG